MNYKYMMAALVRYGIKVLSSEKDNEIRQFYFEDIRESINTYVGEMNDDEIRDCFGYLTNLSETISNMIERLFDFCLGTNEDEEENKFFGHALHEINDSLREDVHSLNVAFEVVNFELQELRAYLPAKNQVDILEKKINKCE